MEHHRLQSYVNQKETLTFLNLMCKKMNFTPAQLLQEDEENQEHNSSDSMNQQTLKENLNPQKNRPHPTNK